MKKLTWLLMSLMLFLGMGTAFATVILPTFTPGDGAKVAPGQAITIGVDESYKDMDGMVIFYTFDQSATSALSSMPFNDQTIGAVLGGQYASYGLNGVTSKGVAQLVEGDDNKPVIMNWMPDLKIPANAQGQTRMFYRFAIPSGGSYESTSVEYVTYTVEGEAAGIPAPTFSPAEGPVEADTKVTISGPASTQMTEYSIAYVINNENFDFTQYTGSKFPPSNMMYTKAIVIDEAKTITAAVYEVTYPDEEITRWSKPVTASYTIAAATPDPIAAPTYTPASGSTVNPGDEITFDVPAEYQAMAYLLYTTNATDFASATTYEGKVALAETVLATDDETGDPTYTGPIMVAAMMNGNWRMMPCRIPSDAEAGALTLSAYLFIPEGGVVSEIATANYTVEAGETPGDEIPEPTFDPAAGKVAAGTTVNIECGESPNPYYTYMIYRVLNNPDFDFTQYLGDDSDLRKAGASYSATVKINATTTITAATAKVDGMTDEIIAWSEKVSATYTVEEAPSNIPVPVFSPDGGAVPSGTKLILTNGTESDATPLPIYYNTKDDATEYFDAVTTQSELTSALKSVNKKLIAYPADGIEITKATPINAATAEIDAEGNVTWSTVITRRFTIGETPTPGDDTPVAPTFSPDGGEIEAEAEIAISTSCSTCKIYYSEYGDDFVTYKTQDELDAAANSMMAMVHEYDATAKPTLGDMNVSTPGAKLSLSAASASFDASGNITWSEVTTREFTVKAEDEPVVDVAIPTITPANDAYVHMGDMVTIECETEGAEIYYTTNGTKPFTMDKDGYPVAVREGDDVFKYTEPFALTEDMLIQQRAVWALKITAVAAKGNSISANGASAGLNVLPNAPEFSVTAGEVIAGTKVTISCVPSQAVIYYTLDNTTPTMEEGILYEGPITITEDVTIRALAVLGQYQSSVVPAAYTVTETEVELSFDPASGSEVEENTAVTITSTVANVDIFYMMFESEEAAKAAEWDQEKAELYTSELQPVLSAEKNTIKAAYALPGAEALEEGFFYATYTVKVQPAIDLTFNPASGSAVEEGTTITITASRKTEIFYNLYADAAAADADTTFTLNAKEVTEDGMPVITKGNTYLRCAVSDKGEMKYFNATYTIKTKGDTEANEDLELAGVSVYPNPSNGVFNIELPVAATVEVFAINGVLMQHFNANAGNVTLNINRSGIYFLRITGEGRTAIKRIIVR